MKLCPNCGAELEKTAVQCFLCDYIFDDVAQTPDENSIPPEAQAKAVPSSKKKGSLKEKKTAQKQTKGKVPAVFIALIVVLVCIILAMGVLIFMMLQGQNDAPPEDNIPAAAQLEGTQPAAFTETSVSETTAATITSTAETTTTTVTTTTETVTTVPKKSDLPEYKFISGKYTWEEAQRYCEEHGGHLATFHSFDEWNELVKVVKQAQAKNRELKYVWLGGKSALNSETMKTSLSWVNGSDTGYILGDHFSYWYYDADLNIHEPSGYDANHYVKTGELINEPYLLMWYMDSHTTGEKSWSLNDVPDVSAYSMYNDNTMGFVMEMNDDTETVTKAAVTTAAITTTTVTTAVQAPPVPSLNGFYEVIGNWDGQMFRIDWSSAGADGYEVYVSEKEWNSTEPIIYQYETLETSYDAAASIGIDVIFKVRAYKNADGQKLYSDWSHEAYCKLNNY